MQFIPFHRPFGIGALLRLAVTAVAFGVLLSLGGPLEVTQAAAAEGPAQENRQGPKSGAPTEEPAASLEVALKHYQDLSRTHWEVTHEGGYSDARPVSTALEQLVRAAFERVGSFHGARELLSGMVSWHECPKAYDSRAGYGSGHVVGLSDEHFLEMKEADVARVFYAEYPTEDDREAVILVNTLLTREQGTDPLWLQTWPYALVRTGNTVQYKAFGDKLYNSAQCKVLPLGVISAGTTVPTFVSLYQFSTRAQKVQLLTKALIPDTNEWDGMMLEWTGVSRFTYEAAKGKLTLWEDDAQEVIDVAEQIEKWGPQRKWKLKSPTTPAIPQSTQPEESAPEAPLRDESSSVKKSTGDASALSTSVDGGSAQADSAEFAPVRPVSSTSADSNYQSALLGYHQIAASCTSQLQTSPDTSVQARELDSALKMLVRAAFEELRSLKAVQENLKMTIEWVSMPANPHELDELPETQRPYRLDSGRLSEAATTEPPYVYFCSLQGPDGLEITVMLNSLVVRSSFVGLEGQQTEPYAVVLDRERMTYSSNITATSPYGWLGGLPHVTQILDITLRPQKGRAVLLAVRSYVSGSPLSIYSCDYDPASGMWQSTVEELMYVDDWSYNDQTGQVAVTGLTGKKAVHNYPDFVGLE